MKRKYFALVVVLLLLFSLAACGNKPSGDPKIILEEYWQSCEGGDGLTAYNLLCAENRAQLSLEEFQDWRIVSEKLWKELDYKISKEENLENYSFKGVDYEYAIRYTIVNKNEDYVTGEENSVETQKIVVSEDKEWKVLDEESYATKYASCLDYLGWAYRAGKLADESAEPARAYFLRAIEVDPDFAGAYYDLASEYALKEEFEKALEYINIAIAKAKDDVFLSDCYNYKGLIFEGTHQLEEAKVQYQKAVEMDPTNVYAIDNLEALQ